MDSCALFQCFLFLISQEEIFHICGEEVNLYLAGVNRLEIGVITAH